MQRHKQIEDQAEVGDIGITTSIEDINEGNLQQDKSDSGPQPQAHDPNTAGKEEAQVDMNLKQSVGKMPYIEGPPKNNLPQKWSTFARFSQ